MGKSDTIETAMTNGPDRKTTTDARSRTRSTLLRRVANPSSDKNAWREFVEHYESRIKGWCRAKGMQDADAEDVTQTVLLKLAVQMRTFEYDRTKSFRAWLKTITNNALLDAIKKNRRARALLENAASRQSLIAELKPAFDRELLDEAMARVKQRVEHRTWEAFRLTTIDRLSSVEAGQRLGVPETRVRVQKSRVAELIREEIKKLRGGSSA